MLRTDTCGTIRPSWKWPRAGDRSWFRRHYALSLLIQDRLIFQIIGASRISYSRCAYWSSQREQKHVVFSDCAKPTSSLRTQKLTPICAGDIQDIPIILSLRSSQQQHRDVQFTFNSPPHLHLLPTT